MPEAAKLADQIREDVRARHIEPARQAGRKTVTLRAGDVARDMGFKNRAPAVCGALGSKMFLCQAGLRLLERVGPLQSTATEFHFEILDRSADESLPVPSERVSAPSRSTRTVPKGRGAPETGD